MEKQKYQLENPNNARIFIDYKNKKKPVRFEYVGKNSLFKQIFSPLFILWIYLNLILVFIILIIVGNVLIIYNHDKISEETQEQINMEKVLPLIALLLTYILYVIGIPIVATLMFCKNKKLLKLMPKINYILSPIAWSVNFKPEQVKDNKVEIPMFKNVGLDYNATKEFSKYLERVEVTEHEFNMFVGRGRKKKPQEYLWKAVFYFSEQPKTGELYVEFK